MSLIYRRISMCKYAMNNLFSFTPIYFFYSFSSSFADVCNCVTGELSDGKSNSTSAIFCAKNSFKNFNKFYRIHIVISPAPRAIFQYCSAFRKLMFAPYMTVMERVIPQLQFSAILFFYFKQFK